MFCLRYSSLKLYQRYPFTYVSAISSTSFHKGNFDNNVKSSNSVQYLNTYRQLSDARKLASTSAKPSTEQKMFDPSMYLHRLACSFKEIQLRELSKAPTPAFWYGMAGLIPFWFPPLSAILTGYSPFLATCQLTYAATICSFLGGIKWGLAVPDKPDMEPSWSNLSLCVLPQVVAWISLLLPQVLGFLGVASGLAVAAFLDITSPHFPVWFRAMRIVLSSLSILALLLMFIMRLFH